MGHSEVLREVFSADLRNAGAAEDIPDVSPLGWPTDMLFYHTGLIRLLSSKEAGGTAGVWQGCTCPSPSPSVHPALLAVGRVLRPLLCPVLPTLTFITLSGTVWPLRGGTWSVRI